LVIPSWKWKTLRGTATTSVMFIIYVLSLPENGKPCGVLRSRLTRDFTSFSFNHTHYYHCGVYWKMKVPEPVEGKTSRSAAISFVYSWRFIPQTENLSEYCDQSGHDLKSYPDSLLKRKTLRSRPKRNFTSFSFLAVSFRPMSLIMDRGARTDSGDNFSNY
jgi:hypothetical protein